MRKGLSVAILALLMVSLLAGGCPRFPQPAPQPAPPGLFPPPDEEWSRTFGGGGVDAGYCVQQTTDGGFIIAGWTESFGAGGRDFWLIKSDQEGKKEWSRTFGGSRSDAAFSVQETVDGGFIIAGRTESFGAGGYDFWLVKTDQEGNKEWSRTFGGIHCDSAFSVQQTVDGGFIIAGWTESFGVGDCDFWLVKTDQQGNEEWSRTFGGSRSDAAFSVQQTADGGFIIAGCTISFGAGLGDSWLVKTDQEGNKEWSRTFGGRHRDGASSVQETSDGGFIIAGRTESFGAGFRDFWLIKSDQEGNKEWSRTFGGRLGDWASSVQQTGDGGFIIAGGTESFGAGRADFWVVETDEKGNKAWGKTFGGIYRDPAKSVQQTADGGFIVAGYTASFGAGDDDLWLIKIAPVTGQ